LPSIKNPAPADLIEVGYIVDAYGIKGWVKIQPFAAAGDSALKRSKRWWLSGSHLNLNADERDVLSSRVHGDSIVAELVGVSDRDLALKFKGASISIRRSDFPSNPADEYYWIDLIGCSVTNAEGISFGAVSEVFDNGAHAVFRIVLPPERINEVSKATELLIPFVSQFVSTVDIDAKTITVDWPLSWLEDTD
jgi:16S rRNA processing protein RimM